MLIRDFLTCVISMYPYQDNYPWAITPGKSPPPPENYSQGQLPPENDHRRITSRGQLPSRTITPWRITPEDNYPRGQPPLPEHIYPQRTTTAPSEDNYRPSQDNYPEDNNPPRTITLRGQLPPMTITPEEFVTL